MTSAKKEELNRFILIELSELAPEADLTRLDPEADLREELDIDSFDFVRFITALSQITGKDVPEEDYIKLTTLASATAYFVR